MRHLLNGTRDRLLIVFFGLIFCDALQVCARADSQIQKLEIGVGLTPANFPNQSADDITNMYRKAADLGNLAVINLKWDDPNVKQTAEKMTKLAVNFGMKPMIQLDILETAGTKFSPPGLAATYTLEGEALNSYTDLVRELASLAPPYLSIGVDINRLLAGGTDKLALFARNYQDTYELVKSISPQTKVFVSFNWDIFVNAAGTNDIPINQFQPLIDLFRPKIDILAFTSVPKEKFILLQKIPDDYWLNISYLKAREPLLLQVGWPSKLDQDVEQSIMINKISSNLDKIDLKFLIWPILHDLPGATYPTSNLGLFTASGKRKIGADKFKVLANTVANKSVGTAPPAYQPVTREARRKDNQDKFAIYTNNLAGDEPKLLVSDPSREINHAHVSPDHNFFAFTRYNVRNNDGLALETTSYFGTEILVCKTQEDICWVVKSSEPGKIAANASWTPDGRGLLFVDYSNGKLPGISLCELDIRGPDIRDTLSCKITQLLHLSSFSLADPHMVKGMIVSTFTERNRLISKLCMVSPSPANQHQINSSSALENLTSPSIPNLRPIDPPLGDHDPKISPDGKKIAFMRHFDQDEWRIITLDLESKKETDLSGPKAVDAVPEWSPDGKSLIFWHVDTFDPKRSGIYTISASGSDRQQLDLPPHYFYSMPAFWPGDFSSKSSRIIYSARSEPIY